MTDYSYKKLLEKLDDKGFTAFEKFILLPRSITLHDPSILDKREGWVEEVHKKELEDLHIWIDHQKHR